VTCWSTLCPCTCCKRKSQREIAEEKINLIKEDSKKRFEREEAKVLNDIKQQNEKKKKEEEI